MKIFDNIMIIDLGLLVGDTLIFSDFHIGYEEALNKQGIFVPRQQFENIIKRLDKIFSNLKKVERIIINGDIKHEFGKASSQEWKDTLKLLDYFSKRCNEIILIKGNHDKIIGPIADKRKVKVLDHFKLIFPIKKNSNNKKIKNNNNRILVTHGEKIPDEKLLKDVDKIIIGHEHPAVSIKDGPRVEKFKCLLAGKFSKKDLIVLPSFNLSTEGTDVIKEKLLSPFLKNGVKDFNVFIVADKAYDFGRLENLK